MPRDQLVILAKATTNSRLPNAKHRARALELYADPSDLAQTDFGVCGMAAVCYTLLVHRPDIFAQVAVDIIRNTRLVKEIRTNYWAGKPSDTPQFDYLVMAGLAYRLRDSSGYQVVTSFDAQGRAKAKVKQVSWIFSHSVQFSRTFDVDGVMWTPQNNRGHFATTQQSLAALMENVVPRSHAYKLKHDTTPANVMKRVNVYFNVYEKAFAFVGIKHFLTWATVPCLADQDSTNEDKWKIDGPPAPSTGPTPKFEHWVWLSAPIQYASGWYTLYYWTWREKFRIILKAEVFQTYIYGWIAGHLDMSFKR